LFLFYADYTGLTNKYIYKKRNISWRASEEFTKK